MSLRRHIVWRMGLNPYNVYGHCAGGIPAANGVISEDDDSVTVVPPEMFSDSDQEYDEFIQVRVYTTAYVTITSTV